MIDSVECGSCGATIEEEGSLALDQRQPCAACGSTTRKFSLSAHARVSVTASATLQVITYPRALITIAEDLITQGRYGIALVTSHMACEVAAERAMDAAYAAQGLQTLGEAVDQLMNGHNLANDRHRKLYNALTGTQLETQPFWAAFKTASEKRNAIVHRGAQASREEAEAGVKAAEALAAFLKQL